MGKKNPERGEGERKNESLAPWLPGTAETWKGWPRLFRKVRDVMKRTVLWMWPR